MLLEQDKAFRFLTDASYLKNFKQTNKNPPRPTKPPTVFLPWLFWNLWVYSWSFPAAEDHRWKCSFRAVKSLWNISLQLPVCAHISQRFQKGCPCPGPLFLFPDCFFLTSVWLDSSFCLPLSVFPRVLPALWRGAQQSRLERTAWVLLLCSLLPQTLFETFAFLWILGLLPLGIFPLLEW